MSTSSAYKSSVRIAADKGKVGICIQESVPCAYKVVWLEPEHAEEIAAAITEAVVYLRHGHPV